MGLPDRLKIVRDALGLSQKDMAKKINVSLTALQGYEADRSVPGGNVIERLVRLGFNANWILTGEGEMRRDEPLYALAEGLKNADLTGEQLVNQALTISSSAMKTGDLNADLIATIVKNMTADRTSNEKLEINAAIMLALAEARKRQDDQRNRS
jgi:transcriptional regulator with XRE-family HTH domain